MDSTDAEQIEQISKLMTKYANELDSTSFPWLYVDNAPDTPAALLGLSVCMYFYPFEEAPEALIWCINDYLDKTQEHLSLVAGNDAHFKKFTPKFVRPTAEEIRLLIETDNPSFSFQATSAKKKSEPGHFSLSILYEDLGWRDNLAYARFTLPAGFVVQQEQGSFERMLVEWSKKLRPFHGTGGIGAILPVYSLSAHVASASLREPMGRHPGMQVDTSLLLSIYTKDGIPGVSWYTMISNELLDSIGGKAILESNLDRKTFALWNYPGGVGIRAGLIPVLGDTVSGDIPRHYAELHRLLRPVYAKNLKDLIDQPTEEDVETFAKKWLYRYDGM